MKWTVKYCVFIITFIFIAFVISSQNLAFFRENEAADLSGPSLFFIETNATQHYLSVVSACSVESAAKHHPLSPVIFYKVGSAFDAHSPLLLSLRRIYPNIRFTPLDPNHLFRGTPLQDENGSADEMVWKIFNSPYPEDHMSDVARAALLWKHGGVYLDTDVIVRRPLDTVANSIGREVDTPDFLYNVANTHVMAFEKNSEFLYKYMTILRYNFTSMTFVDRITIGPMLISNLLMNACGVSYPPLLPLNAPEKCGGINVAPLQTYNTVNYQNAFSLFEQPESKALDFTEARAVHLSHSRVKGSSTAVGSGSYLDLIFKENCPVVYEQIQGRIIV